MKRREPKPATAPRALKLVPGGAPQDRPDSGDHPSKWSRPHVRSLAIASGKGGVGKSTLAANLAIALGERGARVLLVDADFSQANLDLLLGVHPRWDLQHVLAGEKTLEEIVVEGPAGVKLVPAASGSRTVSFDSLASRALWCLESSIRIARKRGMLPNVPPRQSWKLEVMRRVCIATRWCSWPSTKRACRISMKQCGSTLHGSR